MIVDRAARPDRRAVNFARRLVDNLVVDRRHLADPHLDLVLLGLEFPGQSRSDIGVEPDRDRPSQNMIRRLLGNLRCAAESGRLAEPVVERHRGVGGAHHAHHNRGTAGRNQRIAPQRLSVGSVRGSSHCFT